MKIADENMVDMATKDENLSSESMVDAESKTKEFDYDAVLDDLAQDRLFKDTIFNDLLGDYTKQGDYVMSEDIMQELIDMPKKIDFVDDAGIHARGFLNDRVYTFCVTKPIIEENGNAYSFLKIEEKIDRLAGYMVETQSTIVATYDYKFDEFYDKNLREVFHLKEYDSDDTGEEGRKYQADRISKRYEMFYAMREVSEEYAEKLEEIYFNQRILLLGMDPELTVIMAEFSKKRAKLDAYFIISRRRFYFLNQLLDQILLLQNNQTQLSKSEMDAKLKELDKKFVEKAKEINKRTLTHPKVAPFIKEEKQEEIVAIVRKEQSTPKPQNQAVKKGDGGKSGGGKKRGKGGQDKGGGGNKPDKKGEKPKYAENPKYQEEPQLWSDKLQIESMANTVSQIENEQGQDKSSESAPAVRTGQMSM